MPTPISIASCERASDASALTIDLMCVRRVGRNRSDDSITELLYIYAFFLGAWNGAFIYFPTDEYQPLVVEPPDADASALARAPPADADASALACAPPACGAGSSGQFLMHTCVSLQHGLSEVNS